MRECSGIYSCFSGICSCVYWMALRSKKPNFFARPSSPITLTSHERSFFRSYSQSGWCETGGRLVPYIYIVYNYNYILLKVHCMLSGYQIHHVLLPKYPLLPPGRVYWSENASPSLWKFQCRSIKVLYLYFFFSSSRAAVVGLLTLWISNDLPWEMYEYFLKSTFKCSTTWMV